MLDSGAEYGLEAIDKQYPYVYSIIAGLVFVGIGIAVGYVVFADTASYTTNLFTEAISVALTVFVLNVLAERREQGREKQRLNLEMGSNDNGIALKALREAHSNRWLHDGTFRGMGWRKPNWQGAWLVSVDLEGIAIHEGNLQSVQIVGSNLKGAFLDGTDFRGAHLRNSELQGASLQWADLRGEKTILWAAKMQGAKMWEAKMQKADLTVADLRQAEMVRVDLEEANLAGADLRGAHLQGANLKNAELVETTMGRTEAKFDETTYYLPDNTLWTPETDMKRFTDPDHPNFWRSDKLKSPAYRGDSK